MRILVIITLSLNGWTCYSGLSKQSAVASPDSNSEPSTFDCKLCDRKFLFVLGTGRSGSTTIMQMINEIPGYYISGEHGGQLEHWKNLMTSHEIANQNFVCMLQDWIYRHARDPADAIEIELIKQKTSARAIAKYDRLYSQVRGFKEIRYTSLETMRWIKQVFPCSKFIINYREISELIESRKRSFKEAGNIQWLNETFHNLTGFHEERKYHGDTFALSLDQFSVDRFNDMIDWLGVKHCRFVSVATNKGQRTKYSFNNPKHIRCWDEKWDKEVQAYFDKLKREKLK